MPRITLNHTRESPKHLEHDPFHRVCWIAFDPGAFHQRDAQVTDREPRRCTELWVLTVEHVLQRRSDTRNLGNDIDRLAGKLPVSQIDHALQTLSQDLLDDIGVPK
jgi:hypothetical protein